MAALTEHQVVELTQPVDKDEVLTRGPDEPRGIGQWPAGTKGAIVIDFGGDKLVEIYDQDGIALDFVTVPATQLELFADHSGGGPKARRFEQLLGIRNEAAGYLEGQIKARLLDTPAIAVRENPHTVSTVRLTSPFGGSAPRPTA